VDSVVASPNRKCLYLNCGQHKTNIAAVLINAMLHSVSKDYYPEKIICRKMSVYLWFKNICNAMDIKLELVEELPSTFEMFKRLRGEDVGFPRTSCKLNI